MNFQWRKCDHSISIEQSKCFINNERALRLKIPLDLRQMQMSISAMQSQQRCSASVSVHTSSQQRPMPCACGNGQRLALTPLQPLRSRRRCMLSRQQPAVNSSLTAEGTGTPEDPDRIPDAALASTPQTAPGGFSMHLGETTSRMRLTDANHPGAAGQPTELEP